MLQFGFLAAVFWWALIAFNMCLEVRNPLQIFSPAFYPDSRLAILWRASEFGKEEMEVDSICGLQFHWVGTCFSVDGHPCRSRRDQICPRGYLVR